MFRRYRLAHVQRWPLAQAPEVVWPGNWLERRGAPANPSSCLGATMDTLGRWIWRACYALEEARQTQAALGHRWREAGFCVLLAIMNKIGAA